MKVDPRSVRRSAHTTTVKSAKKVPFVELYNNRLQGVVSSGSSHKRVYVSFVEAGTTNFYCSTNNNRKCGGLRGYPCKHIKALLDEACLRYSSQRVISYLGLDVDPGAVKKGQQLIQYFDGNSQKEQAGEVFSRFLNYLRYVELEGSNEPVPEMSWFLS